LFLFTCILPEDWNKRGDGLDNDLSRVSRRRSAPTDGTRRSLLAGEGEDDDAFHYRVGRSLLSCGQKISSSTRRLLVRAGGKIFWNNPFTLGSINNSPDSSFFSEEELDRMDDEDLNDEDNSVVNRGRNRKLGIDFTSGSYPYVTHEDCKYKNGMSEEE
jgi:hypothetical protein